jgi:DNA (cytosine-5)-methyltransferase 1
MPSRIRVIDLFAGPGGLGEGFSAFRGKRNVRPFHLEMSVEKEVSAHRTLELRALVRQFAELPDSYYDYLRGALTREELFSRYPAKAKQARRETLYGPRELGPGGADDDLIYTGLQELKSGSDSQWLVIGGPPCQAYSLVGRARNKGVKGYRAEKDRRHFLYEEYLKVLSLIRPQAFVMENVKGILSSKVHGEYIFPRLLEDLTCPDKALGGSPRQDSTYRIYSLVSGSEIGEITGSGKDCIIRTEDFGVPQSRHRVILLGVRGDIDRKPTALAQAPGRFTVGEMLAGMPRLRSGLSRGIDSDKEWLRALRAKAGQVSKELDAHGLDGDIALDAVRRAAEIKGRGGQFQATKAQYRGPEHLAGWIPDSRLRGFANYESRGHIPQDLARYLYCASFAAQCNGDSPRSHDFPESLAPDHRSWNSGKFADRFKVQARTKPSSTITSHISKDGHYFIHYDPAQCRSLTVREAARLQTFPDNYFFEGNRTQQYVQVGNAVPPWLAHQIAGIVYELLT